MKLLFIGNSHTYFNDMPSLVQMIGAENEINIDVTMLAHGGMGLDFHAEQPEVRFNILFGGYDAVILQHDAHPFRGSEILISAGEKICELIKKANSKSVLFMTWTEENNKKGQSKMADAYYRLGEKTASAVAPVGEVWWKFIEKHPEIKLYDSDGQHASTVGSRLAAYVIFSVVSGIQAKAFDSIDKEISCMAYESIAH